MEERIVITGTGTLNPLGLSVDETWKSMLQGRSGVGPITLFDASDFPVKIAAEIKGFVPENYLPAKEARRRDRFAQIAAASAQEAINQSGIKESKFDPTRVGVFLSSAIGGLKTIQDSVTTLNAEGPRRLSPFTIPMLMPNGASGLISIDHGFLGPALTVGSACASGNDGIGIAWLMLRAGIIDAALAGGSETTITQIGVGAFDRLGAVSKQNETDAGGCYHTPRPFDKNRDGLVMGEGTAALVLETESHAKQRGAVILAELAGYAATSDAYHVTAPSDDGSGGARAIRLALKSARINVEDVGYINAHGTATPLNDLSETRAIKAAFGNMAYNIPVSSTKSMTGHLMGATAAVEAVICTKIVREGLIPPTINYETPDPDCDLDYVPNQAREQRVTAAVSNAFGFGGHNAVLVVKAYT